MGTFKPNGVEKTYKHIDTPANDNKVLREKIVNYDGSKILVLQKSQSYTADKYTVVLGEIWKQEFAQDGTLVKTIVFTIDQKEHKDLEAVVRKAGFEGDIQFW
jgi:hypothetical protein